MSELIKTPILENVDEKVRKINVPDDLMSFPDCPKHCNKGKIFDPYTHRTKTCPYCAEKRRTLLSQSVGNKESDDTLLKRLNLSPNLFGTSFDFQNVIPESDRTILDSDSYVRVKDETESLLNMALLGEEPDTSHIYGFGLKANIQNFVYPLLVRYYLAGTDVAPFMPATDLTYLRSNFSLGNDKKVYDITYSDLIRKALCVVWLDAGSSLKDIDVVKGLMEQRAMHNLATIIVSSNFGFGIIALEKDSGQEQCKHLATPHYVFYDKAKVLKRNETYEKRFYKPNDTTNVGKSQISKETSTTSVAHNSVSQNMSGVLSNEDFNSLIGRL